MKKERKFYQQSWFIMLLLFSPLFPVGLFLMWKEKGMNIVFKIIFTLVYVFSIVYTIQTQHVLFTMKKDEPKVESKVEAKNEREKELSPEQKDVNTMFSFVAEHEEQFGEFYQSNAIETFDKKLYDSVYDVKTSGGKFVFFLNNQVVNIVTDEDNEVVYGLSY